MRSILPAAATLVVGAALGAVPGAAPARAIDCGAVESDIDKAICSAPQAVAADDAMVAAYNALRARGTARERHALLVSQRAWLKRRGYYCPDDKPDYAQCLGRDADRRRAFLAGLPESGPGAGSPLKPVIAAKSGRPGDWEIDVEVLRFVTPKTPGEKTFNAAVQKIIDDIPGDRKEIQRDRIYSHTRWLRLSWLSPKLISARIDGYAYTGGAHGDPFTQGLNIDMKSGRKLTFSDAFDKRAHDRLMDACMAILLPEKARRGAGKIKDGELQRLRENVDGVLSKLDNWNFTAGGATIVFGSSEIGAYAEGPYQCDLPFARLKELAAGDFPLPE